MSREDEAVARIARVYGLRAEGSRVLGSLPDHLVAQLGCAASLNALRLVKARSSPGRFSVRFVPA